MNIKLNNTKNTSAILARKGYITIAAIDMVSGNINDLTLYFNFENSYTISKDTIVFHVADYPKIFVGENIYSFGVNKKRLNTIFPKIISDNINDKLIYVFCSSKDLSFEFNLWFD